MHWKCGNCLTELDSDGDKQEKDIKLFEFLVQVEQITAQCPKCGHELYSEDAIQNNLRAVYTKLGWRAQFDGRYSPQNGEQREEQVRKASKTALKQ